MDKPPEVSLPLECTNCSRPDCPTTAICTLFTRDEIKCNFQAKKGLAAHYPPTCLIKKADCDEEDCLLIQLRSALACWYPYPLKEESEVPEHLL